MAYKVHHIHLKAADPKAVADWYAEAFGFKIIYDQVLSTGDRFIRCSTGDDFLVNISGPKEGEALGAANCDLQFGLEHFAMETSDLQADIDRLTAMGAKILEGPFQTAQGRNVVFIQGPAEERIELMGELVAKG